MSKGGGGGMSDYYACMDACCVAHYIFTSSASREGMLPWLSWPGLLILLTTTHHD